MHHVFMNAVYCRYLMFLVECMPGVSMETQKRSWGVNEDEVDTPTGTRGGRFVSLVSLGLH